MYSTVHITSDPTIPTGMSRCGFFASCAAVDTASNPMYAKKITPAPRATPDHPNCPNSPRFGGTNGCQFAAEIAGCFQRYPATIAMNVSTVPTFMNTTVVLTFADSRTPITKIVVMIAITTYASRSITPRVCGNVAGSTPACASTGPIVAIGDHNPW